MPKTQYSEWDATAANNTDINSINIAENCAMANLNNAIREMMAQLRTANFAAPGADPNADRIVFWDDSAGAFAYLSLSPNLVISGTELRSYELWGGAVSDETTAITTGAAKLSFSIPYNFAVVGVYATLNTASSSGTPTFDINEGGTTILSTKIVIDANELTGGSSGYQGTASGAAVISDAAIAAFAQITVDIDTAGTGAKGAKVFIVGYRTA